MAIEVRRIPDDSHCVICDAPASIEVSNSGSLKLFWACGFKDREITLCDSCARAMRDGLSSNIEGIRHPKWYFTSRRIA